MKNVQKAAQKKQNTNNSNNKEDKSITETKDFVLIQQKREILEVEFASKEDPCNMKMEKEFQEFRIQKATIVQKNC